MHPHHNRVLVLAVMILAFSFNILDRQIVSILAGSIKRDLGLTDGQLGLMGGLAFAIFFTGFGVPIAVLADRWSRSWILTGALTIWSGFTALCGLATGFWSLFLCRMGVGLAESGGTAPAYSLISDYFPRHQRARAIAAYGFGIPIGSAAGILLGGFMAHAYDWRTAFIVVGLAGIVLAPIVRLVVWDPPRETLPATTPPLGAPIRSLLAKPSFWLISLGSAASAVSGYGVAFWLPSFFERSVGMTLLDRSVFLGAMNLVGGIMGIWLGGWLGDRLGRASPAAYLLVPAACFMIALPVFVLAIQSTSLVVAFVLLMVSTGLNLAWLGPVLTAVQHLVPASARATGTACFLLIYNLLGIGLGTWLFGAISDALMPRFGDESLRYAIYCGLSFYVISAALLGLAARRLRRDWVE